MLSKEAATNFLTIAAPWGQMSHDQNPPILAIESWLFKYMYMYIMGYKIILISLGSIIPHKYSKQPRVSVFHCTN